MKEREEEERRLVVLSRRIGSADVAPRLCVEDVFWYRRLERGLFFGRLGVLWAAKGYPTVSS